MTSRGPQGARGGRRRVGRGRCRGRLPLQRRDAEATARLDAAVRGSTLAYRHRLSVELALIQGLLNMGATTHAAGALEEGREALAGFAADLREALVEATAPLPDQ